MKKTILLIFALLMVPAIVLAQTATSTPTAQPVPEVGPIIEAYRSGAWGVAVGGTLMLVIAILRGIGLLKWVSKQWVPWVTMLMAMALSVAGGLIASSDWAVIVQNGITAGLTAVGGWEVFGKLVRDAVRQRKEPPPDEPDELKKADE